MRKEGTRLLLRKWTGLLLKMREEEAVLEKILQLREGEEAVLVEILKLRKGELSQVGQDAGLLLRTGGKR